jgi:hypothetical protein
MLRADENPLRSKWAIASTPSLPFRVHVSWGILVYISQGVTQEARLVKNLTPSVTMVIAPKASPVRKRVRLIGYIFGTYWVKRKENTKKKSIYEPLRLFSLRWPLHFSYAKYFFSMSLFHEYGSSTPSSVRSL